MSIDVWSALSPARRDALVAALQRIADAEARSEQQSSFDPAPSPPVTVVRAVREGDALVIEAEYAFVLRVDAQAGSDWTEHHHHVLVARCEGDRVASHDVHKRVRSLVTPDRDDR